MSHAKKIEAVTTYVTTDGTIFTGEVEANTYEETYNNNKESSSLLSSQKSKLVSVSDDFGRVNPYFYYISRGGEYTNKRLGLGFSTTTPKDVLKNLMVSSPKEMNKILTEVFKKEEEKKK